MFVCEKVVKAGEVGENTREDIEEGEHRGSVNIRHFIKC